MYIYGFGQLENVKIENVNEFQIVYGENEAGKSTIMAFIHGILFGFPTKQQTELRYEPKNHTNYGGKIRIFQEKYGYAIIERVKGKSASGDVSVTLANGVMGGDELLKTLLSNIDKGLFQSVFSFNLHSLQNIQQMKKEDIGKFLFSAGALGSERLSFAETELQKELDSRFKPGGKKPALNEKLLELHEFNSELKKALVKSQEYEQLVEQKEKVQIELEQIQDLMNQLQDRVNKLSDWKKIKPFVMEKKWLENELKTLGHISFPVKGIERYEKLNQLIKPYTAQITSLSERMEKIKKEIETMNVNHSLIKNETEILAAMDKFPLYDQLVLQQKQLHEKLLEIDEELLNIKEKLHIDLSDNEIIAINTNIYMKDQVERLSIKGKELKEEKQQLDERFTEEKEALEDLEATIHIAKSKILPESERMELEAQLNKNHARSNIEIELKAVQEKIKIHKKMEEQERQHAAAVKAQKIIQFSILCILFIGITIYGLVAKQSIFTIIGGVCFLLLGIFVFINFNKPKKRVSDPFLADLKKEEMQLMNELETPIHLEIFKVQTKLELDQRFKTDLQIQNIKLEQQLQQYEKIISRFEQWEKNIAKYKEEIKDISSQLKVPETIADAYLLEVFQLIEQFKLLKREKRQLHDTLENLEKDQLEIVNAIQVFENQFLTEQNLDLRNSVYLLRDLLKDQHEKAIKAKEKQAKLQELTEDLVQLKETCHHLEQEVNLLFVQATVETENEFYKLGEKAELEAKLLDRVKDIGKQLEYFQISNMEIEDYLQISDCDERINEDKQEITILKSQKSSLREQKAALTHTIQLLEEGGLYSELLHQFKQKKFELEEVAKEWAAYRLAQDILTQTIEKYKNLHLPRMLTKAEGFLSFLTEGNYCKILLQSTGTGFLIERKDHTIFEANELSQATTEQVYVSIRLSLALTLFEKFAFPIIIDDSFVNFDAKRTQKVMELLKQLKQNQILFFTCHRHLLDYFQQENILFLEKGAVLEDFIE